MELQEWIAHDIVDMMVRIIDNSIVHGAVLVKEIPSPCHAQIKIVIPGRGVTEHARAVQRSIVSPESNSG